MIAAGAIPPSSSSPSSSAAAATTSPSLSVPTRRRPLDPSDADPSVDDHSPAHDGAPFARRRRPGGRLTAGNWWLTRLLAVALVALLASALLLGTARIGGGGGAAREQKEEVLLQINAHEESMGWTAENAAAVVKRSLHPQVVQLLNPINIINPLLVVSNSLMHGS